MRQLEAPAPARALNMKINFKFAQVAAGAGCRVAATLHMVEGRAKRPPAGAGAAGPR